MKHVILQEDSRRVFEKLNNYYGLQGVNPEFSQIRIEESLVAGKGTYDIDVKKANASATETSLRRNDLFIALSLGFYLAIQNPNKPGVFELMSYPKIGTAAAGDNPAVEGFSTKDIEALYNGKLYLQTGTIVNLEDMPMSVFRKVPEYQGGSLPKFDIQESQVSLAEKFVFAGSQDHTMKVTFPSYPDAAYSSVISGNVAKLVFIALGYKVPGGTGERFREEGNPFFKMI